MRKLAIATAPDLRSAHWEQEEVTWDEIVQWAEDPASVKASGGVVYGALRETVVDHRHAPGCVAIHRNRLAVSSRSVIGLDIDDATESTWDEVAELLDGWAYLIHTTFSSTAEAPRYRVLIPLTRDVSPADYQRIVGWFLTKLTLDERCQLPEQFMYRPATGSPDDYRYHDNEGEWLDPDVILERWSHLPEEDRPTVHDATASSRSDPFDAPGYVGPFNRVYQDFDELIDKYDLPYTPVGERWLLDGASGTPGLTELRPGLFYSHHANDPAHHPFHARTAFDVVRLHRFQDLDESAHPQTPMNKRPSYQAMLALAEEDVRVRAELQTSISDFDVIMDSPDADNPDAPDNNWELNLRRNNRTEVTDTTGNWRLIMENDPVFRSLYTNEMGDTIELDSSVAPWPRPGRHSEMVEGADRVEMRMYLDERYRFRPGQQVLDQMIQAAASQRKRHPVREYLEALEWDGVPRVETCLPGVVNHTPYTRMVARKAFAAAVARVFRPGIKWDHMVVLYGREGVGKTWWLDRMSRGWMAPLGRVDSKDTTLAALRTWFMVSDEGNMLRKADADIYKEFLTKTADVVRMPYDRDMKTYPRHCVFWGTTNDLVFLRRQEGNRRFLIVHCEEDADVGNLKDSEIDQIWAEAVQIWLAGEPLIISDADAELAAEHRDTYTAEDTNLGKIEHYLSLLVPDNWSRMSRTQRSEWMWNHDEGLVAGDNPITEVCLLQILVEALGYRHENDVHPAMANQVTSLLNGLPGWRRVPGRRTIHPYGRQVVYERIPEDEEDPMDLI